MATYGAEWKLSTSAGLWATWLLLSDTDRLNRSAGIDVSFARLDDVDGDERFQGSTGMFGSSCEWIEAPFDFEAPRWLAIERLPTSGPITRWSTRFELTGHRGGTDISCSIEVEPGSLWTRRRVSAAVDDVLIPRTRAAMQQALALLEGRTSSYDAPPPPLPDRARRFLEEKAKGIDADVAAPLVHHICHAPLHEQVELSPITFATQWGLHEGQTIRAFVEAARLGILTLEWAEGRDTVPAPYAQWDGRTPGSIVALFRTNPRLRRFEVPVRCPFSPSRTPHMLARRAVPRGSEFAWQLTLSPDLYEIVVPGLPRASLQTRPGLKTRSATVDITEDGILPAVLRTAQGDTEIQARSTLDRDVHLSLVTRTRGRRQLSAGRLVQEAGLPRGAVDRFLGIRRERAMVLAVQPLDDPARALRRIARVAESCRAESLDYVDDAVVATWPEPAWMLSAAETLACDPRVGVALGVGEVVFVGKEGTPAGQSVEGTILMARRAGGSRTVASVASLQDPVLSATITRWGERLTVVPHNSFLQLLDFARARAAQQQRPSSSQRRRKMGKVLGRRYRLGEELGRGGFGRVMEARDLNTGRDIAVKILLPEYAADPIHAQRFYTEARITSSLRHANTLRVLDWGQAPSGELYLAMERLDGLELRQILRDEQRLEPQRVARMALDVLGSLGEAHQAGIVHRDIKPANIFLCTNAVVKVIDFGIAWSAEDASPESTSESSELVIGTPRYMSPEQLEGEVLDGRSDIYSVGLTLYECIAGELPFEGGDQMVMAYRRLTKPIPPLRDVVDAGVPTALDEAVLRALARDPDRRFQDCATMRAELARVARGR